MTSGREREREAQQPAEADRIWEVHAWRHGCGRHLLGLGDGGSESSWGEPIAQAGSAATTCRLYSSR